DYCAQSTTAIASISTIHSASASAATPGGIPFAKKFRLIVYDIGRDLHDIGVARAGGGKRQSDISHRLRCLRGQVSRADQRTTFINGHLASRVDGTPA